uniref:Uncharacterized protein n=1 Tax=Arundo donax TaxID=35708 RepID=A0A0A9EK27_ARUDO
MYQKTQKPCSRGVLAVRQDLSSKAGNNPQFQSVVSTHTCV